LKKTTSFSEFSNELPFLIKKYPSQIGFSSYMHRIPIGTRIEVMGPFGKSHGLSKID